MKTIILALFLGFGQFLFAQQIISQWNFNSSPPDGDASTGTFSASLGSWSISPIGSINTSFTGGSGSSDTVSADNSGFQTSSYPSQGQKNLSAGILLQGSSIGFKNLSLQFDIRATGTASKYYQLQFSLDSGSNWQKVDDFQFSAAAGSWQKNAEFNLETFPQIEESAWLMLRLVSSFAPDTNRYQAVSGSSSYSSGGTVRFDMISIRGESTVAAIDTIPPKVMSVITLSNKKIQVEFDEGVSPSSAVSTVNYKGVTGSFSVNQLNANQVELNFSNPFPQGIHHKLEIKGVSDTSGNAIKIKQVFDVFRNESKPGIVISEIMYNNPGDDDYEFLEIYNPTSDTAYLEAFSIQGVVYTFKREDKIAPKAYLLLAKDSALCNDFFSAHFREWHSGSLSNSGECIGLFNQVGDTVVSVCYDNTGNWPKPPNGDGSSLELKQLSGSLNLGSNWQSSFYFQGFLDSTSVNATPGFGYEQNKISFKTDTVWFAEGDLVSIPFQNKMVGKHDAVVKISTQFGQGITNSDFEVADSIFKIDTSVYFWTGLQLKSDGEEENTEFLKLKITAVDNGSSTGFTELVVAILGDDVETNVEELPEKQTLVYPNPTNGKGLVFPEKGGYELQDLEGRTLQRFFADSMMDLSEFPKGLYLLKSMKNGSVQRLEIIEE